MMKKFLALLSSFIASTVLAASATFTADTTTVIPNPERGPYLNAGSLFDASIDSTLISIRDANGFRLASLQTVLPFNGAISGANLTLLSNNLGFARTRGMKLILRFSYCTSSPAPSACNPDITTIQSHAQQLKPYLYANRDVIAFMQAGLLGTAGEWNADANGLDTKAGKRLIKEAALDMVPPELTVSFDQIYPLMEDWYAGRSVVNSADAFTGSKIARSGLHTPCFMGSGTDRNFYTGPTTVSDFSVIGSFAAQRAYAASLSQYAPFGGETCNTVSPAVMRVGCTTNTYTDNVGQTGGILNEGPRYHLAYLNWTSTTLVSSWVSGGCDSTIKAKMGYRFQLDNINHSDSIVAGATTTFTITMHNTGWAGVFSERRLHVLLTKSGSANIDCASTQDLRRLQPQSVIPIQITVKCPIPSNASAGTWNVNLRVPSHYASLAALRYYMIRFANANSGSQQWDDTNGWFATGTQLAVSSGGSVTPLASLPYPVYTTMEPMSSPTYNDGDTITDSNGIVRLQRVSDPGGSGKLVYLHQIPRSEAGIVGGVDGNSIRSEKMWIDATDLGNPSAYMALGNDYWYAFAARMKSGGNPANQPGITDEAFSYIQSHSESNADTQPPFAINVQTGLNRLEVRTSYATVSPGTAWTSNLLYTRALPTSDVWYKWIVHSRLQWNASATPGPLTEVWLAIGNETYTKVVTSTLPNDYNWAGGGRTYPRIGIYKWGGTAWGPGTSIISVYLTTLYRGTGANLLPQAQASLFGLQ